MRTLIVILAAAAVSVGGGSTAAEPPGDVSFPLSFKIVDSESKQQLPPYIVMFEGGVDRDGKDVRRPLGRLKALRGASKMFPESNKDPGLPVVLRGIRFSGQYNADGSLAGGEVELQGEFNAVRVAANATDLQSLLAGRVTKFSLIGEKNYGIYAYISTMTMEVQLKGDKLLIFKVDGDFSFREGLSTYQSKPKRLTPPAGREFLYRGEKGELPGLPVI